MRNDITDRMRSAASLLGELADADRMVFGAGHAEREKWFRSAARELRRMLADHRRAERVRKEGGGDA